MRHNFTLKKQNYRLFINKFKNLLEQTGILEVKAIICGDKDKDCCKKICKSGVSLHIPVSYIHKDLLDSIHLDKESEKQILLIDFAGRQIEIKLNTRMIVNNGQITFKEDVLGEKVLWVFKPLQNKEKAIQYLEETSAKYMEEFEETD